MLFPYFSEEDLYELEETIHENVEEYMTEYGIEFCQPDFYKTMIDTITQNQLDFMIESGIAEQRHFKRLRKMFHVFAKNYLHMLGIRRRAYKNPKPHHYCHQDLSGRVAKLNALVIPDQRSPEWYQYRHNMMTASNIWKAIGSEANKNSLIMEKCKPYVDKGFIGVDSPLHWGQKYEPVTVQLYEYINQTKVHEYGCIAHPDYPFIGASPDGITTEGRMLEIKNVVSREITGIPKMDYWVQMQVQLEVCDLEDCDFVETQFKEYDDHEEDLFYKNLDMYDANGVILYFIKNDFTEPRPHYVYMPLSVHLNHVSVNEWINEQKVLHKDTHILFKKIFWYCEKYSCVLVKRNRVWFDMALPHFRDVWNTILKERQSGFEHRMPKARKTGNSWTVTKVGCMIDADFDVDLGPAVEDVAE